MGEARDDPRRRVRQGLTLARIAETLAAQAGLRVPAADLEANSWTPAWNPGGTVPNSMEGFSGSGVTYVLDGEQLRLLGDRAVRRFWRAWWREQQQRNGRHRFVPCADSDLRRPCNHAKMSQICPTWGFPIMRCQPTRFTPGEKHLRRDRWGWKL